MDAAFTRGVSRDASSTGAPTTKEATASDSKDGSSDGSTLSLSGLLNSLDGVAAAEGRYDIHSYIVPTSIDLTFDA